MGYKRYGDINTGINIPNLKQVRNKLASVSPDHCYMGTWFKGMGMDHQKNIVWRDREPECGTAACLAGWAAVARYGSYQNFRATTAYFGIPADDAMEWFGLEGTDLFYVTDWPRRFARMADEDTNDQKAMIAILDALIAGEVVERYDHEWSAWKLVEVNA